MEVAEIKDYEAEFKALTQRLSINKKAYQKTTDASRAEIITAIEYRSSVFNKAKDEIRAVEEKIENIRKEQSAVLGDKDRAGRECQQLQQELEQMNSLVNEKIREKESGEIKLAIVEQRLKAREQEVEAAERKQQEHTSNIEKGAQLFRKHLGLTIGRTNHGSLVFTFTQISRSNPNKEYLLELTLDGDHYRLLCSVPPLPNLKEIEDKLNATNNFSGCISHVRKIFQKTET